MFAESASILATAVTTLVVYYPLTSCVGGCVLRGHGELLVDLMVVMGNACGCDHNVLIIVSSFLLD